MMKRAGAIGCLVWYALVCFSVGDAKKQTQTKETSTTFSLVSPRLPASGSIHMDSCAKTCPIVVSEDALLQKKNEREAFKCRSQARKECMEATKELGFRCMETTLTQIKKDIGYLFGEKICRIQKKIMNGGTLTIADAKFCACVDHSCGAKSKSLEFDQSTSGFKGDKESVYYLQGNVSVQTLWNVILKHVDDGTDRFGLANRISVDKELEQWKQNYGKQLNDVALKVNVEWAGFQFLASVSKIFGQRNIKTLSTLFSVYAESTKLIQSMLSHQDKLTAYAVRQVWPGCPSTQGVMCEHWCRSPDSWDTIVALTDAMLTLFENKCTETSCNVESDKIADIQKRIFTLVGNDKNRDRVIQKAWPAWTKPSKTLKQGSTYTLRLPRRVPIGTFAGVVDTKKETGGVVSNGFKQIAAGFMATCGLTTSGQIECRGTEQKLRPEVQKLVNSGKPMLPLSGGVFIRVGVWGRRMCGLTSAGVIECNADKQQIFKHRHRFTAMGVGGTHVCGISSKKELFCFDENGETEPFPGFKFSSVSCGKEKTCGIIRGSKTALCIAHKKSEKPFKRKKFRAIGVGNTFECGLTTKQKIKCSSGMSVPKDIQKKKWTHMSVGEHHVCVLQDKIMRCFGTDKNGQRGQEKDITPKRSNTFFIDIAAGDEQSCGLTAEGHFECIGQYWSEVRGDAPTIVIPAPTPHYIVEGTYTDLNQVTYYVQENKLTLQPRTSVSISRPGLVTEGVVLPIQTSSLRRRLLSADALAGNMKLRAGMMKRQSPLASRMQTMLKNKAASKQHMSVLKSNDEELKEDVAMLKAQVGEIPILKQKASESVTKRTFSTLQSQVSALSSSVDILRSSTENAELKAEVKGLKSEVAAEKHTIRTILKEVDEWKSNARMAGNLKTPHTNAVVGDDSAVKTVHEEAIDVEALEAQRIKEELVGIGACLSEDGVKLYESEMNSQIRYRIFLKEIFMSSEKGRTGKCIATDHVNLLGVNAVDASSAGIDGERTAFLEIGATDRSLLKPRANGVEDVQYVYEVKGDAPFIQEEHLYFNRALKVTESSFNCRSDEKHLCKDILSSKKYKSSFTVRVHRDEDWCCSSTTSYKKCIDSNKRCADKIQLHKEFEVTIRKLKSSVEYEIVEGGQGRRRKLLQHSTSPC
jgi:hypothetical protein